jgi:hypothetical protein
MALSKDSADKLFTLAETAGDVLFNLTDTLHALVSGSRVEDEATTAAARELTELRDAVATLVREATAASLIAEGA